MDATEGGLPKPDIPVRQPVWRYVAALIGFVALYLTGGFGLYLLGETGYGVLTRVYPDQTTSGQLLDLLQNRKGAGSAPVLTGLFVFAVTMLSIIIAIPAVFVVIRYIHGWRFSVVLGPRGLIWRDLSLSLLGAGVAFTVVLSAEALFLADEIAVHRNPGDLLHFLPLVVLLLPLQVLSEEVVFRGYLLKVVSDFTGRKWVRVSIPALVFALLHFPNAEVQTALTPVMLHFLIFSGYITWLTVQSGSLAGAIGVHMANNIFAALVISSSLSDYLAPTVFHVGNPELWLIPLEISGVLLIYHLLMRRWRVIS